MNEAGRDGLKICEVVICQKFDALKNINLLASLIFLSSSCRPFLAGPHPPQWTPCSPVMGLQLPTSSSQSPQTTSPNPKTLLFSALEHQACEGDICNAKVTGEYLIINIEAPTEIRAPLC